MCFSMLISRLIHFKLNHLSIHDRNALKVTQRMSEWTFSDSPALVSAQNTVPRDLQTEFWVTVSPWVYWLQSRKAVYYIVNSEWVWSRRNCFSDQWQRGKVRETCLDTITFAFPFDTLKASLHTQLLLWILSGQQLCHFFSCHNDVFRNQLRNKEKNYYE